MPTVIAPVAPRIAEEPLVRNPTEHSLKQPSEMTVSQPTVSQPDEEELTTDKPSPPAEGQVAQHVHLNLEDRDKSSLYAPSHTKDDRERIQSYVEQVQKNKRQVEDLTKKLASSNLKFTQYQETVDKKFA